MMTRWLKIVLPLVVLASASVAARALINSREEPKPRPPEDRRPLVHVLPVTKTDVALEVDVYGTVRPRTEIVVLTDHRNEPSQRQAFDAGVRSYLFKDCTT